MILNVIIEPTDPIEMHQQYEKAFIDSKGGMEPIEFSGMFRFDPDFEVEYNQFKNARKTRFKLLLIDGEQYIGCLTDTV